MNGDGDVVRNSEIASNHDHSEVGGFPPILTVSGKNNRIENNYVHDTQAQGISVYVYDPGSSIDGTVISGNVLLGTCTTVSGCGALYIDMHGGSQTSHVTVKNNFVRDYGAAGVSGTCGICLTEASNVTVTGISWVHLARAARRPGASP